MHRAPHRLLTVAKVFLTHAFLLLLTLPMVRCGLPDRPTASPVAEALVPATLALSPSGPRVAAGSGQSFTVRASFPDGHIKDVSAKLSWSVIDEQGRSINGIAPLPGLITPALPGRYRVRATSGSQSVETILTVTAATLKSVAISPLTPTIALGTHQQFTLTGTYSDGTTQDVSALAAWSVKTVTGTNVATIYSSGLAISKSVGTTKVTGRYNSKTASTVLQVTPAVITSLTVTPVTPSIAKGTALQFAASATFSDGTKQDVTALADWSVQDIVGTGVADIDDTGNAVGLAVGQVAVSADYEGATASTTMTVTSALPTSLTVTPAATSIPKGTTQAYTAVVGLSDGTTQNVTAAAAWTTTDVTGTGVAAIDVHGVATGHSIGSANIAASYSGLFASATLDVTAAVLNSYSISPVSASIAKGTSQRFVANGTFSDGTVQDLSAVSTWSITDVMGTGVASIDSHGNATGKNIGKAAISASYLTASANASLQVTAATLDSISITPVTAAIGKGATQRFAAIALMTDGTTQDVSTTSTWSTSDVSGSGVATVDGTGLATGKNEGTCWVTGAYHGKTSHAVLTVSTGLHVISTGTTQVLWGLWGSSSTDVWAVGGAGTILHFDGTSVSAPTTLAGVVGMNAVWGSAAHDVWFGGDTGLLLHFDGTTFVSQTLNPAPSSINGLWGSGPSDVWAATTGGAYHYDGTSWMQVTSGIAAAGMTSAWGSGAKDVWFFEDGAIDHWDGTTLSKYALPAAASIYGISGTGARDIWAVGSAGNIFHYDGTAWSVVTSGTSQNLVGVSAVGMGDVVVTGDAGTILHWNGTSFAAVTSPTTEDLMSVFRVGGVTFITGWDGVLVRGL